MKAVIMAGGQGTRLRTVAADIPKPMVPVLGKPVLQYQIENLKENGFTDIILMIGYLGDSIRSYFGNGSAFGVSISYVYEDHPMGTAGALYYLKELISDDFLLIMGDLMLSVDFGRFMRFHRESGGIATLFVHPNAHPYDSDIIVTDETGSVEEYTEEACRRRKTMPREHGKSLVRGVIGKKEERLFAYHNQVNSGIYAFRKELLSLIPKPKEKALIDAALSEAEKRGALEEEIKRIKKSGKVDLDKDIILPLILNGQVYAYRSTEYVKDMGTPDRYQSVSADLKNGVISHRNLTNKQKCIFLDRDGTINELCGFLNEPKQLQLLPGAAEAIKKINASEYLCIVLTNQPVIARGECSFETLDAIHARLETLLGMEGAYIDDLFYCPHHTDKGFAGEVAELKFDCGCRKPKTGLLQEAAARYNIDLEKSWMIGDMTGDIQCGKNAGLKTVLLKTGMGGSDKKYGAKPDAICEDLLSAVEHILSAEAGE